MKILKRTVLSIVLVSLLITEPLAQRNAQPPQGPSQSASVSEILDWLDKDTFARARVGLKDSGNPWGADSNGMPTLGQGGTDGTMVVYSQGFKLMKVDGCTLTLRNEDAQIIALSKSIAGDQRHFAAELYLPLNKLSDRKGKTAHRHTKDIDKARLLGAWRTEFTYRRFFSHAWIGLALFNPGTAEKQGFRASETVTFTFDSKEMAEEFNAAFRRAIKLCKQK